MKIFKPKKLSESYWEYPAHYAYCAKCQEVYIDDLPGGKIILCPNGCESAVERGMSELEARKKFRPIGIHLSSGSEVLFPAEVEDGDYFEINGEKYSLERRKL